MNWLCAQAGCDAEGTHLAIQSHPLSLLFKSGSAILCVDHAESMSNIGGISVSLADFVKWLAETGKIAEKEDSAS